MHEIVHEVLRNTLYLVQLFPHHHVHQLFRWASDYTVSQYTPAMRVNVGIANGGGEKMYRGVVVMSFSDGCMVSVVVKKHPYFCLTKFFSYEDLIRWNT